MKEKTSVTLSADVLVGIDRLAGRKQSRSAIIEGILRQYLRERVKAERRRRELAILNRYADELNQDAEDGLEDQAPEQD
jgi:metal-responsive CopG/Arc/MetJ family transcriptional regulator